VVISRPTSERLMVSGLAKLRPFWIPEFRNTESSVGWAFMTLKLVSFSTVVMEWVGKILGYEVRNPSQFRDVKLEGRDFVIAMFLNEGIQILFSSANCYYVRSIRDHLLGEGEANSRGCPNHQHGFVREGHV